MELSGFGESGRACMGSSGVVGRVSCVLGMQVFSLSEYSCPIVQNMCNLSADMHLDCARALTFYICIDHASFGVFSQRCFCLGTTL